MPGLQVSKDTVHVESGDAILCGDIYRPAISRRSSARDRPVIIIETGLSLNRYGLFTEFAKYFAANGMTSFVYDKRSHNESTGKFTCSLLKEDLINIMKFLSKNFGIQKFGLFGFCFGGITAIEAAADCKMVKVLCGVNTYNNYLEVALAKNNGFSFRVRALHKISHFLHRIGVLRYLKIQTKDFHIAELEQGKGYKGDLSELFEEITLCNDPIEKLKRLRKPFFLFHGKKDKMVPDEVINRLYAACPSREKKIFCYPEAGHFFREQRAAMLNDCLKIFQKHLI